MVKFGTRGGEGGKAGHTGGNFDLEVLKIIWGGGGFIQYTCLKVTCNSKVADRRPKQVEI